MAREEPLIRVISNFNVPSLQFPPPVVVVGPRGHRFVHLFAQGLAARPNVFNFVRGFAFGRAFGTSVSTATVYAFLRTCASTFLLTDIFTIRLRRAGTGLVGLRPSFSLDAPAVNVIPAVLACLNI